MLHRSSVDFRRDPLIRLAEEAVVRGWHPDASRRLENPALVAALF